MKNQKGFAKFLWVIIIAIIGSGFYLFSLVNQVDEQKLSCEEKIEQIGSLKPSKVGEKAKIVNIKTNIVEYPLNKKEVMVEYCITVANFTSDMMNLELRVEFLDKDENVFTETEDYIFDIPGMRMKTEYGSEFVEANLSQEIKRIQVSPIRIY